MHSRLRHFSFALVAALLTLLVVSARSAVAPNYIASSGGILLKFLAKEAPISLVAVPDDKQDALIAKGKERFKAYKCGDCHGDNGEGTPDGPDLTHSTRTADQVSKFLQKPSADAVNKGMPDIPMDNPDHAPLVAYVMSIRAK